MYYHDMLDIDLIHLTFISMITVKERYLTFAAGPQVMNNYSVLSS